MQLSTSLTPAPAPSTGRSRGLRLAFATVLAAAALSGRAQAERSYFAWGAAYDPNLNYSQQPVAVAMDRRGNVAVCGYTRPNNDDVAVIVKYDSLTGAALWAKSYNSGFGDNHPADIACDSQGNVIVTGESIGNGTSYDYFTVKYAAADGAIVWQMRYNNPANTTGQDSAKKVVVDFNDDVIVTGLSVGAGGVHEDFYTIKYAKTTGNKVWEQRYNSAGNFIDYPTALAVGTNGDVAVTGVSRTGSTPCYYTAKYASSNGNKIWDKTYDGPGNDDDIGTGVAIDTDGNVLVTGRSRNSNATYSFHTLKYRTNDGFPLWQKDFVTGSTQENPFIALNGDGDAFVAGTAELDNFKTAFYAAKYDSSTGNLDWETHSSRPGFVVGDSNFIDDEVVGLRVDGAGNALVAGTGQSFSLPQTDSNLYVVKFSGASGTELWQQSLDGETQEGDDLAYAFAADRVGNVAILGRDRKTTFTSYFDMITAKFNHYLLSNGDPIAGPGLSADAVITGFNVAALADSAAITAKVTVQDGRKKYGAILSQFNGNYAFGLQGQPSPGVANGVFKSFSDPVISPSGTIAFAAKLSGVPGANASGVWTDTFNATHTLQLALQAGQQVPGMPMGVVLKSVTSISLRDGYLAALITVKGTGISGSNSTVLLGMSAVNTGYVLAQTNQMVTVDTVASTIKKITVFSPPKTSPGQGRYQGNAQLTANLTLADKRVVSAAISSVGNLNFPGATNGDASAVQSGAKYKSFGLPSVGGSGFYFASLATLQPKLGNVTPGTDTAIVYSLLGGNYDDIAREGGTAPDTNSGTYVSFNDPVSNDQGRFAFLASAKGGSLGKAPKTGLWFGVFNSLNLVTTVGAAAPDALGNDTEASFSAIKNIALPGGAGAGPLFLGSIKGKGVSGKNNAGLWGVDSAGHLRELFRTGDVLGDQTVKKFVMLNSLPGCFSANRSFNASGGAVALVSFTDRSQAVVYIGVP